jgi:glycosyltransferase involved in cell wall biosynthesis
MLPRLDIVVPVFNERRALPRTIPVLARFARRHLDTVRWRIVIVDNGSTDGSSAVAERLAESDSKVSLLSLPQAGRGGALRAAWMSSDAAILSYMDVDLSADLDALPRLVDLVLSGWDLAVGSRHLETSQVRRSLHRSFLSHSYNLCARQVLGTKFSDAQCGLKVITARAARDVLPQVRNERWFFDTELLAVAEVLGYRIAEVAVRWTEDRDSRVRLLPTVFEDLCGLGRMRLRDLPALREQPPRPVALTGNAG